MNENKSRTRVCSVDDCRSKHFGKGFCFKHYRRWKVHGNPLMVAIGGKSGRTIDQRLWNRVVVDNKGCWNWTGTKDTKGYGSIRFNKKGYWVHRFAWQLTYGEIPVSLMVCHRCDNPSCINPAHLFLGTAKDNSIDMMQKNRGGKGRFIRGHLPYNTKFTEEVIREIRSRYSKEAVTQTQLAQYYGTSQGHITNIVNGRAWSRVQ